MELVILIFLTLWIWLFYEAWRAPAVREEADGSITYLEEPKKLFKLWKKEGTK